MKLKICEWLIRHGMRRLAYSLSPSLFWISETKRGLNEAMKRLAEENIIDSQPTIEPERKNGK